MKYIFLCVLNLITCMSSATNELELVVAPTQIGRVNDHEIRWDLVPPGGKIHLQVKLKNLDFNLAGAEFIVRFPGYATTNSPVVISSQHADYQCNAAPIQAGQGWGDADLLILPVDTSGNRYAGGTANQYGMVRFGAIVKDPNQRPVGNGSGELILAELEFHLGNLSQPTCVSSHAEFVLERFDYSCDICDYFADEQGNRITMSGTSAVQTVSLVHPDVPWQKGDMNRSSTVTTQDVGGLINCANQGQASANCPLNDLPYDEYLQIADLDCNGSVNPRDTAALIRLTLDIHTDF